MAVEQESAVADKPRGPEDVSDEIGASYIPIINAPARDAAEAQVFACLYAHRKEIVDAERTFGVTRIAIAGAIAWEMLENKSNAPSWLRKIAGRSVGYGKVHTYNIHWKQLKVHDTDTIAKQTEDRGYIAPQSKQKRDLLLATPEGAIRYIGAIMAAIADVAGRHGAKDIRFDPEILTNVYNGKDLKSWEADMVAKPKGTPLRGGNRMDRWVMSHLDFLVAAVGLPKS